MKKQFLILLSLLYQVLSQGWVMWKQCDPRWANIQLGFGSNTICSAGCLMTSVSMAITMMVGLANPETTNQWLKKNGGYVNGGDFVWASVQPFGLRFGGITTQTQLIGGHLYYAHFVMANVNQGRHWVIVTGYFNDYVTVHDPGYNKDTYGINEIVRYGWYQRLREPISSPRLSNVQQLQNLRKSDDQVIKQFME